jgi:transcriptional regulator with XRE-family HTH domain
MQHAAAFDQIKLRAARIRLPLAELARRAGFAGSTAHRIANGLTPNPRVKTVAKLDTVLIEEETAMRRHLRELERSRDGRQLDLVNALASRGGAS